MPRLSVERRNRVFHVHVIDAVGKGANELDRINTLPVQVAGIKVEAKFFAIIERLKRRSAV